jgi:hypothetical protein
MQAQVTKLSLIAGLMFSATSLASAEPVKFNALVAQKEAIRLDFADNSKHFFLLVRREGKSEGQGPLAGATESCLVRMASQSSWTTVLGKWSLVQASLRRSRALGHFI